MSDKEEGRIKDNEGIGDRVVEFAQEATELLKAINPFAFGDKMRGMRQIVNAKFEAEGIYHIATGHKTGCTDIINQTPNFASNFGKIIREEDVDGLRGPETIFVSDEDKALLADVVSEISVILDEHCSNEITAYNKVEGQNFKRETNEAFIGG